MALARKNLLDHVMFKTDEALNGVDRSSQAWKSADMNAFAIVSRLLNPQHQSMVRESSSAREAWELLESFFVRHNLHNRIQLRRQLRKFEMASGASILDHLMRFGNLCLGMAAVGDALKDDEKLVILLGSLSADHDAMTKTIENNRELPLVEAKEILRRGHDTFQTLEQTEVALKAQRWGQTKKKQRGDEKKHASKRFTGRRSKCGRVGRKQNECRSGSSKRGNRQGGNNGV